MIWPVLKVKKRSEPEYQPASEEIMETAEANMAKRQQVEAAARKSAQENKLQYRAEKPIEQSHVPQPQAGPSAAAGKSIQSNSLNPFNKLFE